ncbi:MAG: phage major capsid protein [Lachnospiraceae bacterium]|nr:phage major capsid protein [Lachnospiraceae bacterium]
MKSTHVDFSGFVTKNDIKCTDGRTIKNGAFKHCDGMCVPLVWQHCQNDPENILGKIYLEHRDGEGVYGYGIFNNGRKATATKELVLHGDIDSMSIHANKLVERNGEVYHGDIIEVSLVTRGANAGAKIEHVSISHGDGTYTEVDDEAVIHYAGDIDNHGEENLTLDLYGDGEDPSHQLTHEDSDDDADEDETIEDIFNTLTDKQKQAVYAIIGAAVADSEDNKTTSEKKEDKVKHSDADDEGGNEMRTNAFENQGRVKNSGELTHADIVANGTYADVAKATFDEVFNRNIKFRDALRHAATQYGIENIEILFPDAKSLSNTPELVKRRTEWVTVVMGGTRHVPFSRIKSVFADITADEAKARGYIKGNQKIEEIFPVMTRTTTPQTIYKKQKLDRDDILDITDFDVVAWLRAEMRIMLEEEIARAILIGDGRLVTSPDKISETNVRPIWTDDAFYSYKHQIPAAKSGDVVYLADSFVRARPKYEGRGVPTAFMSPETLTDLLLTRDNNGNRVYKTEQELKDALRVSAIVEVPLFYGLTRADDKGKKWALNAIIVNLSDYTVGADKGGEISSFNDFDIDYNQEKYLIETRISGALTGYHSAVVIETEATTSSPAGGSPSAQSAK